MNYKKELGDFEIPETLTDEFLCKNKEELEKAIRACNELIRSGTMVAQAQSNLDVMEKQLKFINFCLNKTPVDRVEWFYNKMVEGLQETSTVDSCMSRVNELRTTYKGYKDAESLARKYEDKAKELRGY